MKSVAIVGSGIGGLCTGIRLLAEGYCVTIYEKNETSGGAVSRIQTRDGRFSWDECASIAINRSDYEAIFESVGKNPKDYFEWLPLEKSFKIFYEGGESFALPNNKQKLLKKIAVFSPSNQQGYRKYLEDTDEVYQQAKEILLQKSFLTVKDVANKHVVRALLEVHPLMNANSYLKKYLSDKRLIRLNLFQTFFMGVSPYQIPSIYAAIAEQCQNCSLAHIKGGLSAYKAGLVKLFRELGGTIHYNHEVLRIVGGKQKEKYLIIDEAILKKQKRIKVDKIVINVDYPYALSHLLGIKKDYSYESSCSTYVIHLGLDCCYKELEVHNLYMSKAFEKEIKILFKGKLPRDPNLYLYMPSAVDKSFCKNKQESVLNIMVRVPNLKHYMAWNKEKESILFKKCIQNVEKIKGLEDLHDHIKVCSVTKPENFMKRYHYTAGCCFGLSHTRAQSIMFRPQVKYKDYPNIYFTGGSVHPGNGVSIVMMSAKIAAERVKYEDKR